MLRKFLIIIVALAAATNVADAAYRMRGDMGGNIQEHEAKYRAIAASGQSIIIDGPCRSACTVLLDMFSGDRICVTPRAAFGFHSGFKRDRFTGTKIVDPIKAKMMERHYPPAFEAWVRRHNAMASNDFKWMRYREIPLRHCK